MSDVFARHQQTPQGDTFNWEYRQTSLHGDTLYCYPIAADGLPFHYVLVIYRGVWLNFYGQIVDEEQETIDFTNDDLFTLMDEMQAKALKLEHE